MDVRPQVIHDGFEIWRLVLHILWVGDEFCLEQKGMGPAFGRIVVDEKIGDGVIISIDSSVVEHC